MKQQRKAGKFSKYFYNGITYCGAYIAFVFFVIELVLFGVDFLGKNENVYLGIVTYMVFPAFLIFGLLLIPLGAWLRRRKELKGIVDENLKPLRINFGLSTHRNAFFVFLAGTTVLGIMSLIGAYQAFHYTESVHFCGITCHEVMEPEYTRYTQSAHARVKCVECHIGSGADWYVRSKLSGVRQVFATIGKTYSRPIPTPVHNLRPAKETCEQCHWPEKFYSSVEMRQQYFPADAEGAEHTSWFMRMLIHVGSAGREKDGIHKHMYIDNDIYYVADDERRQKISWIKTIDKDGKDRIYTSPDSSYKDSEPPSELIRKMDCIDCHNRPTHRFMAPYRLVNNGMEAGEIDRNLPSIKEKAMEVLSAKYETHASAAVSIRESLVSYYKKTLGDSYSQNEKKVSDTVDYIITIYQNHFFPKMNARWDSYPDNIGHLISEGCFRCHDGEHSTPEGKTISRDCTVCHSIIEQGPVGNLEKSTDGLPFRHPVDIGEIWKEMSCVECHSGL